VHKNSTLIFLLIQSLAAKPGIVGGAAVPQGHPNFQECALSAMGISGIRPAMSHRLLGQRWWKTMQTPERELPDITFADLTDKFSLLPSQRRENVAAHLVLDAARHALSANDFGKAWALTDNLLFGYGPEGAHALEADNPPLPAGNITHKETHFIEEEVRSLRRKIELAYFRSRIQTDQGLMDVSKSGSYIILNADGAHIDTAIVTTDGPCIIAVGDLRLFLWRSMDGRWLLQDPDDPRALVLSKNITRFGRGRRQSSGRFIITKNIDHGLDDPKTSARQFSLQLNNHNQVIVRDLGSRNGTGLIFPRGLQMPVNGALMNQNLEILTALPKETEEVFEIDRDGKLQPLFDAATWNPKIKLVHTINGTIDAEYYSRSIPIEKAGKAGRQELNLTPLGLSPHLLAAIDHYNRDILNAKTEKRFPRALASDA